MTVRRRLFLLAGVVGLGLLGATGFGAVRAVQAASSAQVSATQLQAALLSGQAADIKVGLDSLNTSITLAEEAERWLFVVDVMPRLREWKFATADALVAAREVVAAGQELVTILEDIQKVTGPDLAGDSRGWEQLSALEKGNLLRTLEDNAVRVMTAEASLERSQAALSRININALPPQFADIQAAALGVLNQASSSLSSLAPFLTVLTDIAGVDQPSDWLVLYLNSSELRPGGGFIGFYALATVNNGELSNLVAEDSYATDLPAAAVPGYHVSPPGPLRDHLGVNGWYFRDAAWSPDFAETAQTATQLLRQQAAVAGRPVPSPQIVLGITPELAAALVEEVGPLQLGTKTVTAAELYDVLQYDTQKGFAEAGRGDTERKILVAEATQALVAKILALPPDRLFDLWGLLDEELEARHAAFYSSIPDVQTVFEASDWAGTLPNKSPGQDFLALIDANLGALKTDPAISRSVNYSLALRPGTEDMYQATVDVTYKHDGSFDYKTTRYQTHAQLLVPSGAQLVSFTGGVGAPTTVVGEYQSFAAWVVIEPGSTKSVRWTYDLPVDISQAIKGGLYELELFKQLGGGDNLLTLDHSFARTITAAEPAESGQFGDSRYQLTLPLSQDTSISIRF